MQLDRLVAALFPTSARWTVARKEMLYNSALYIAMIALIADFLNQNIIAINLIANTTGLDALVAATWQSLAVMLLNSQASSLLTKMTLADTLLVGEALSRRVF
jgi:hypothetical protein